MVDFGSTGLLSLVSVLSLLTLPLDFLWGSDLPSFTVISWVFKQVLVLWLGAKSEADK